MSTTTSTLNLVKPASSDYVDISVINDNYDKIDQFAGGVVNGDYVEDASYVHTDNNFTNTLKNKLDNIADNANNYSLPTASTNTLGGVKVDGTTITIADGVITSTAQGGTTVVANPTGTATETLTGLQVGSSIYAVQGGGTTVIANPSGTATTDLFKLQVGNDIYGVVTDIGDLDSIDISSLTDGQILQYNSTAGKWQNVSASSSSLSGLTDVSLSSPTNNQVLTYNSSTSKWENKNASGGSSWTDVTGTLTAGSTSITLSDASITTTSTIEVFDDLDVPYNSKTLSTGSITLTFDAQQSNMSVKVRVS